MLSLYQGMVTVAKVEQDSRTVQSSISFAQTDVATRLKKTISKSVSYRYIFKAQVLILCLVHVKHTRT